MLNISGEHRYNGSQIQNIINQLNAGFAQTDVEGKFVDVNDRYCELTGYSREELMTMSMMQITNPEDLATNLPLFEKCVRYGENFFIEKRYRRKDGSDLWVNNSVSLVIDGSGKKLITAISIDISKQKQAEQVLRDSEERYYNFIHRSTEGIWRFELNVPLKITLAADEQINHFYQHAVLAECNDAMAKMYGFDNSQSLIGARLNQFFPDASEAADYFRLFIESDYRVDAAESKEVDREGRTKYFLNNLFGVVQDGYLLRAWGTQRDITDHKHAEEKLRNATEESERRTRLYETIARSTPDLIYVFDKKYRFTYANKALLDMWGKTSRDAIGKGLRENGYEEWHAEMHEREIDSVIANKKSIRGEVSFPHAELGRRVYDYIFVPVLNDEGEVEAIAGTTRDITEIRNAQQAIRDREEKYKALAENLERIVEDRTRELQRSNEDLQQFAHVASHDLKEPLRKMRMFAGRIKEEFAQALPERGMNYIEKIESAAERMNAMIEGVLLYSTFKAVHSEKQNIDLNKVLNDIRSDLEMVIERTQAKFVYDKLPEIAGTPILIHQLFFNLVNNALKFVKKGTTPVITIESKTSEEHVTIIFTDNGIGFSDEESENIFGPFIRLHGRDKFEGTGLGLSLCRNIVERHGGTITAHGTPDAGASFTIHLPVKRGD
jgi:PAS domain S-box-containing protein